jgi:hypothetical protein
MTPPRHTRGLAPWRGSASRCPPALGTGSKHTQRAQQPPNARALQNPPNRERSAQAGVCPVVLAVLGRHSEDRDVVVQGAAAILQLIPYGPNRQASPGEGEEGSCGLRTDEPSLAQALLSGSAPALLQACLRRFPEDDEVMAQATPGLAALATPTE